MKRTLNNPKIKLANQNTINENSISTEFGIHKRKPIKKGEISILIASASDTGKEREILLNKLYRQYKIQGYEESTKHRILTYGWEDLATQNGHPQDIVNNHILPKVDVVIAVLKHTLGTPIFEKNGNVRNESGVAEEIYYALKDSNQGPLCMLYVNNTPISIAPHDPELEIKFRNLIAINKFVTKLKNKILYKQYYSEDELLPKALFDLAQNISTFFL